MVQIVLEISPTDTFILEFSGGKGYTQNMLGMECPIFIPPEHMTDDDHRNRHIFEESSKLFL